MSDIDKLYALTKAYDVVNNRKHVSPGQIKLLDLIEIRIEEIIDNIVMAQEGETEEADTETETETEELTEEEPTEETEETNEDEN